MERYEEIFATLFRDGQVGYHLDRLYRYLTRRACEAGLDSWLAEDAAQDTLEAALLGIEQFEGKTAEDLRRWALGILRNMVRRLRHRLRRQRLTCLDPEEFD